MTSTFVFDTIMEFPTAVLVFLTRQMLIFFMGPSHQWTASYSVRWWKHLLCWVLYFWECLQTSNWNVWNEYKIHIQNVNLTLAFAGISIIKMNGIWSSVLPTRQSGQNKEMSSISCIGNSRSVTSVSTLDFTNTNVIHMYKLIKVNSHCHMIYKVLKSERAKVA
jgi:hypothetical protein